MINYPTKKHSPQYPVGLTDREKEMPSLISIQFTRAQLSLGAIPLTHLSLGPLALRTSGLRHS